MRTPCVLCPVYCTLCPKLCALWHVSCTRVEYRSRHKAASKLQRLWRTRRDRRREEAEKLRRIKIHEVKGGVIPPPPKSCKPKRKK